MKSAMINIALTDDHPIVMTGIAKLLEAQTNMQVIGQYNSGEALIAGLKQQVPDVLFLDILLSDTTGNCLSRLVSKKYPKIKIIALTSIDTPYQVKDMMQHGCSGYLLKSANPEHIIEAINRVHAGKQFMSPELKEQLLDSMMQSQKPFELTKRELEILKMICAGVTNSKIAEQLYLSLRTIENHRFSMYEKLGVNNTAGLVKVALENGLD